MDSVILASGLVGIATAVVIMIATLINAIRFVTADDGNDRLDDNVLVDAGNYVAYLTRHTSYERDTIIEMAATKFDLDRGLVEWFIA